MIVKKVVMMLHKVGFVLLGYPLVQLGDYKPNLCAKARNQTQVTHSEASVLMFVLTGQQN